MDAADTRKHEKVGNKNNDEVVPLEWTKKRDVGRIPDKNQHYGQEDMGPDETALLVRKNAESMWRAMGWASPMH